MARKFTISEKKDSSFAFFFLVLYTIAVLIRPHEMFSLSVNWIIIKIITIIALLTTISSQRPIHFSREHWMLTFLVPWIIISGFLNGSGIMGIDRAIDFGISAIIPFFLFSNLLTSIKRQQIVMVICLIAAVIMIHNGHHQQTAQLGQGWAHGTYSVGYIDLGERRITYLGFFSDPNDMGMFFLMCIPITFYFLSHSRGLIKLLIFSCILILGYGIFLTGSRGTFLGLAGLACSYYLITRAGKKVLFAAIVLAPVLGIILSKLQATIDASANERLYAWYDGIHMLLSNPIFGVGKDNFMENHVRVAHNSYIHIAAELGSIGYSLWGGVLFSLLTICFTVLRLNIAKQIEEKSEISKQELSINKAIFFSMVAFLISAFFISRSYTLLLFIFLGMLYSSIKRLNIQLPVINEMLSTVYAKSLALSWSMLFLVYVALKIAL